MRNNILALTFSVVVVAGALVAASPAEAAEADTRPCVTRGEYRQVKQGMTKIRVHAIFDTAGKRLFINTGEVSNEGREYRVCDMCGGNMYKQDNTWTCEQCGYSYQE